MSKDPDATPIQLDDRASVVLTPTVVTENSHPALHLAHEGVDLADHGHQLINALRSQPAFALRIPDFEHEGRQLRITVLTVGDDGTLDPWPRVEGGCEVSGLHAPPEGSAPTELAFVVLAVDVDRRQVLGDHYPVVLVPPMLASTRD